MAKSKTATFIYGLSYLVMMHDDAEFISRLIGFGLSEKEAQTYLHLLKYGPKTPFSPRDASNVAGVLSQISSKRA